MAAIASSVIAGAQLLWDKISLCYSFAQLYRRNCDALAERAVTLNARKADVEQQVAAAGSRDEVIRAEVNDWLQRANALLQNDLPAFDQNGSGERRCFPNCCWRCERIEQAEDLASRFNAILAEPALESVSHPRALTARPAPELRRSATMENFRQFSSTETALNKVMQALRSGEVRVVGVHGTGGVGKTTLVKEVAARAVEEGLYDHVAFATVSKPPNPEKIQDQIAETFGFVLAAGQSRERRAREIENKIKRQKRVLIVLDDLWEELTLKDVGVPYGNDLVSCESKIVLTTRLENVCHRMKCQEKIRLDLWSEPESWDFFRKTAGANFDSREFEEIAQSVARECRGLPLALVAVAKALGDKDLGEWKKALRRLQNSMPANPDDDQIVYERIKLSYDFLKAKEKVCFLMCCLFPEDYNIGKEELARFVFGLGLFREANTIEDARGDAETIAKKLIASGLLLDGDKKEQVKMHDVIRDVAIQIASEASRIDDHENSDGGKRTEEKHVFMVQTGNHPLKEWPIRDTYESYTAISVMSHDIRALPNGLNCPKLRTLLLQDNNNLEEIPDTFFESMNALRVLDLSGIQASSVPSSIKTLNMLRTLYLDRCKFANVSVLGALQELAILSLKESIVDEFPRDIGKLRNLRMLDLTLSYNIRIPAKVLSNLCHLEELYLRGSFAQWQNETDRETSGNAPFEELINLPRLIILKVDIADVKCLPRDVKTAPSWWKFDICVCGERRIRWKNIRLTKRTSAYSRNLLLNTSVKNLPDWFIKAVSEKTEKLMYTRCKELNLLEEHDRGCLASLKSLIVEDCLNLPHLMHHLEDATQSCRPVFEALQELRIHDMHIKDIYDGELPTGSLENVKFLEVQQCDRLLNLLLPSNLIKRLRNLERLRASWISVEDVFGFENLEEGLYLGRLTEIRLVNLKNLGKMWKGPARFADFTNLKSVSVIECKKLGNLFSVSISEGLLHLEDLWVEDCVTMAEILRDEEGIALEKVKLPKLKALCLKKLPTLSCFYAGNALLECPSLEHLHVHECPMFRTPASDFHSSKQVHENDEQHMKTLMKRMKEPEY